MDPGPRNQEGDNPERLKSLACNVKFTKGNNLLHQFVLDNCDPNESRSGKYMKAVLLSMSDVPASVVNALNDDGFSALHLAVLKNNRTMVNKLLSLLANVDVDARCGLGNPPLHLAAELGHLSIIQELLIQGAGIDVKNRDGETAVCVAAGSRDLNVLKFLVREGADMHNDDECGFNNAPLCHAAKSGNLAAVLYLMNCRRCRECEGNALFESAVSRNVDVIKFLLDREFKWNMQIDSDSGCMLLLSAIRSGNSAVVEFLASKGADLSFKTRYQSCTTAATTPLHEAAFHGSSEIAGFLIDQGVDVNAKRGINYLTPLHFAVFGGGLDVVKLLVGRGADLHAADVHGRTSLHCAAFKGMSALAAFLLDQGADLHAADDRGWTPLHAAAREGHADLVRALLDRGADVNVKNADGKTPLDLAREKQNQSCIDVLENVE